MEILCKSSQFKEQCHLNRRFQLKYCSSQSMNSLTTTTWHAMSRERQDHLFWMWKEKDTRFIIQYLQISTECKFNRQIHTNLNLEISLSTRKNQRQYNYKTMENLTLILFGRDKLTSTSRLHQRLEQYKKALKYHLKLLTCLWLSINLRITSFH